MIHQSMKPTDQQSNNASNPATKRYTRTPRQACGAKMVHYRSENRRKNEAQQNKNEPFGITPNLTGRRPWPRLPYAKGEISTKIQVVKPPSACGPGYLELSRSLQAMASRCHIYVLHLQRSGIAPDPSGHRRQRQYLWGQTRATWRTSTGEQK